LTITGNRTPFLELWHFSCYLFAETNNAGFIYRLLPSSVYKIEETSSPGLEPRTFFRVSDLRSCNLAEGNNFCPGVILLQPLVPELQKPCSPGLESRSTFGVAFVPVISPPKQTLWSWCRYSNLLRFRAKEIVFTGTRIQNIFRGCGLFPEPSPNNCGFAAVLLSCLVTKLQEPPSSGLEPRTIFRDCGLRSCNLFSGPGAVLLLCFVS
jgi:hypothetical protein